MARNREKILRMNFRGYRSAVEKNGTEFWDQAEESESVFTC